MDWTVRHVTSHPQWQEAVLLFEMLADATGEGHEMLEAWRMAALEARDSPPKPRPRKRRRGGRRRQRGRPRSQQGSSLSAPPAHRTRGRWALSCALVGQAAEIRRRLDTGG
jgi:hypothetical protein